MAKVIDYEVHLSEKEKAILQDLYQYRVMTSDHIKKKHFNNTGYYVYKVLVNMRKKNLIKSQTLKGSRKGKKGYTYHRMTETGLEYLSRYDKSVEVQSPKLYVRPIQVPYVLMVSELMVELSNTEWEVWDSRKVKKHYNLDSKMNLQGMLITPEKKRYGLYILGKQSSYRTIEKIQSEIKANAKINPKDYIIITKGQTSYDEFINRALAPKTQKNIKKEPLLTGNAIKVYPYVPFLLQAKKIQTEIEWIRKLCDYYGYKIKSTSIPEGVRQSFPIIIEHQGKEYYFVDVTDSDLNKYNALEVYSKSNSSRNWEKREVIAVTLSVQSIANEQLDKLNGVIHHKMDSQEFNKLCNS